MKPCRWLQCALLSGTLCLGVLKLEAQESVVEIAPSTPLVSQRYEDDAYFEIQVDRNGNLNHRATVHFATIDLTATAGSDYLSAEGELVFEPGETRHAVRVPILTDLVPEPGGESLLFELSSPGEGTGINPLPGKDRLGLVIVEVPGALHVRPIRPSPYDPGIPEDAGVARMRVVRGRTTDMPPVHAEFAALGGSAIADVDYTPVSGIVELDRDEASREITIPIHNDSLREKTKYFHFQLFNLNPDGSKRYLSNYKVYILDNDTGISFEPDHAWQSVAESALEAVVNVLRGGDGGERLSLDYDLLPDSAILGQDYDAPLSGTLVFEPGVSMVSIRVPLRNDSVPDGGKTLQLRLHPTSTSDLLGAITNAVVQLGDDDGGIQVETGYVEVREDAREVVVRVLRSVHPPVDTVVEYRVRPYTATPGEDFVAKNGLLEFRGDETSKEIRLALNDDALLEGTETLAVELTVREGVPLGSPSSGVAQVAILDVEPLPPVDPAFSGDLPDLPGVRLLARQSDGRLLVAGSPIGPYPNALLRIFPDGGLDETFHFENGGHGLEHLSQVSYPWRTLAVDRQDRVIVSGEFVGVSGVAGGPGLFRFLPDGRLDRSFAPALAGQVTYGAALFPDDRIAVLEAMGRPPWPNRVAVLKTDGSLDDGFIRPTLTEGSRRGTLIAVGNGPEVYVAMARTEGDNPDRWGILRFRGDGSLDPGFQPPPGRPGITRMLALPDGGLLVGLASETCVDHTGSGRCGTLFRLKQDGSLDTTFTPPSPMPAITALGTDRDGRFLLGYAARIESGQRAIDRLFPDGTRDDSLAPTSFAADAYAVEALCPLGNGDVVVAGFRSSIQGAPNPWCPVRIFGNRRAAMAGVTLKPDGRALIRVACNAGSLCVLESSTDLRTWTAIATEVAAVGGIRFEVPANPATREFFRVRVEDSSK